MTNSATGVRITESNTTRKKRSDAIYPDRKTQKNAIRAKARHEHRVNFIGVDGEGYTDGFGRHLYVLLGVSDSSGYHRSVENPDGLHWEQVFEFLWSCFQERPEDTFAGFFLGYDFAQWFKSFPEKWARAYFTPEGKARRLAIARQKKPETRYPKPVIIPRKSGGWWFLDGIGERMIRLSATGKRKEWIYINDAGPFFQTSLLNVIDPKKWDRPIVTEAEFDIVKRGKESRGSAILDDDMRYYNCLENDILSRLLARYNEGLVTQDIRLGRDQWYGPGRAANEWLKRIDAPTGEEVLNACGQEIWDVAKASYVAGWFEIMCHGHVPGSSFEYDINSAYPSVMASLPCLLHGKWTAGTSVPPSRKDSYTLVKARVYGTDEYIGAMLHRSAQGNRLCRPSNTCGVYWLHEMQSAQHAGLIDNVEYIEWWQYQPCKCSPPLADIARLYAHRLSINKDSAEGKACKLIYNSAYGKCAQSVGSPRFANPIYASLITAGCRIKIMDAIASHPAGTRAVLMVATDAVFFRSAHPGLSQSDKLGDWGLTKRENLTLFKPGHYWDDSARESIRQGTAPKFKARGVNAKSFAETIAGIDKTFSSWDHGAHVIVDADGWEEFRGRGTYQTLDFYRAANFVYRHLPQNFIEWPWCKYRIGFSMVSISQALQWNDWSKCGLVETDKIVGPIKSDPRAKRDYRIRHATDTYDCVGKLYRSRPYAFAFRRSYWSRRNMREGTGYSTFELENTGYSKNFGLNRENEELQSNIITPDGPADNLILDALGLGKMKVFKE